MFNHYCIVRTRSAGVHAGTLVEKNGQEVLLTNSRRIWYWAGAASLSELAVLGTSKPRECKFPCAVQSIVLPEVVEIIPCTDVAKKSIEEVPVWTAH